MKFFLHILRVTKDFGTDPHSDPLGRGTNPKMYQNVTDPERCLSCVSCHYFYVNGTEPLPF
jgi:hypothetical protein